MKSKLFLLVVLVAAIFLTLSSSGAVPTAAQGPNKIKPVVRSAEHRGVSRPIRSLPLAEPKQVEPSELREQPLGRLNRGTPRQVPSGYKDPALQTAPAAVNAMPAPIQSFDGIDRTNSGCSCLPPDPNGEVGPNHYVQMVNLSFAVYSKTGTKLAGPVLTNSLWSGLPGSCQAHNDGDPIVLYDQLADRWLLSQFTSSNNGGEGYHECIAVSTSPDPTGTYYVYDFKLSDTVFHDYPKLGVWPDAYYMSTNEFPEGSQTSQGAGAFAFERAKMLSGQDARMVKFDTGEVNPLFAGMLPSDLDGSTPPPAGAPNFFVEVDDDTAVPGTCGTDQNSQPTCDNMRIWKFHVDWSNPQANSTFGNNVNPNFVLPVQEFVQPGCIYGHGADCPPQKNTPYRLDALGDRVMFRAAYRNFGNHESLVTNYSVVADARVGIRWYEVRNLSGSTQANPPVIYQQSTYAPTDPPANQLWRWMGSAAMDRSGNLAIGFSSSGPNDFPALRYAGRLASDPLNQLAQGEALLYQGTTSQAFPLGRWGDYSDLTVDPTDDCTFWYTNEYYSGGNVPILTSNWRTSIGSFKFPSCTSAGNQTATPTRTGTPAASATPTRTPTNPFTATPGAALKLHFHGNAGNHNGKEAGCTGSGNADVSACTGGGPFLLPDATLSTNLAAHWDVANPALDSSPPRNIIDPNWTYYVTQQTTIPAGPMTVNWWASCGGCNSTLTADWLIQIFLDTAGATSETPVFNQRVTASPSTPNVPALLSVTLDVPALTFNKNLVFRIDPYYIDAQANTHIYYDGQTTCGGGPCDSYVVFGIEQTGAGTPTATRTNTPVPANPTRTFNGLTFAPAVVVDPQRTEGEPINYIDPKNGDYWESGPYGTSTQLSFIHRSVDGGDQFNIVSPVGLRPDPPPGGGDTDIITDDQGNVYFVDLEALVNFGCAVSNDHGNTWAKKNPACVENVAVDRQWLAIDNGTTTGASDNTVFLAFHETAVGIFIYSSPGSTGPADPTGGLVYSNSASVTTGIAADARCGQIRFEPVTRYLYYPCGVGNRVRITRAHVNPGQRTGIVYDSVLTPPSPGGGSTSSSLFPIVAADAAGNIYAVWIDGSDQNVYYTSSTNHGTTWGPIVRVNSAPARSNVMPWAQAGNSGNLVVAWYGLDSEEDSDALPIWSSDPTEAVKYPWYGYVALITNATSTTPNIDQSRFTEKPMHYGQICTGGLGCTTGGDRTMADFFAAFIDTSARKGAVRVVYNDTTSQHHGAHIFEARQIGGPTALGFTLSDPVPSSPKSDPTGDAQWPHYSPTGPGANQPQLDFTQVSVNQIDATTLQVKMTLNSLSNFNPPPGKSNAFWLTRFQAKSTGEFGEEAYRIFYVGAESAGGQTPTFFAGSGTGYDGTAPGNGCNNSTPGNCKIVQYPPEMGANGFIDVGNKTLCIQVPNFLTTGFGAGRAISDTKLYNVTGFSGGRNDSAADVYADVDLTRSFDFTLGNITGSPCGGQPAPSATPSRTPTRTNTPTATITGVLSATPTRTTTSTRTRTPSPTISPTGTPQPNQVEQYDTHVQLDGWRGILSGQSSGGTYRTSRVKNDYAKFRFTADHVVWLTLAGPNQGIAQVMIDGQDKGRFNLYSPNRQYQKRIRFGDLGGGTHFIVVRVTGDKDPNSSDTNVSVDGFDSHQTTVEDNTSRIRYNSWKGKENTAATANTYVQTGKNGAVARLKFNGNRIQWITARGPKYGQADVRIDGTSHIVDLYNPTQEWQFVVPFNNLGSGNHVIEVRPLGTKNASSHGKAVVVDAFRGPIAVLAPSRNPDVDLDTSIEDIPDQAPPDTSATIDQLAPTASNQSDGGDWLSQLTAFLFGN